MRIVIATLLAVGLLMATASHRESATTRPFNDNSIWNRPIAAGAPLIVNSAQMIQLLVSDPNRIPVVLPGVDQYWSVPVYEVDTFTPRCTVSDRDGYHIDNVPVPADLLYDPTADSKMVLIDGIKAYSFWDFGGCEVLSGTTGWGDLSQAGDGIHNFDGGRWGGRATGWNYYAGLILPEEIAQGHIDHALVISIPGEIVKDVPVWPAFGADGYSSDPNALSEGMRLQLDPSVNIDSLPLMAGGKIIARALQTYGAWLGDTGGSTAIYCQEFLYKDANGNTRLDKSRWSGLLDGSDLNGFPTDKLQVVQVSRSDFYENPNPPQENPTFTPTFTPTSQNNPTSTPTATPISTPRPKPTATPTKTPIPNRKCWCSCPAGYRCECECIPLVN